MKKIPLLLTCLLLGPLCFVEAATNGVCGSANNVSIVEAPVNGLCSSGIPNFVTISKNRNHYLWTCYGSNPSSSSDDVNCTAPIIGVCGTASTNSANPPTANLCKEGRAVNMNWLDGNYRHRKPMILANYSNVVLKDYTFNVKVDFASGMRSDFNDLRFTGLDGKTQLSYWIENKTDGVSANIWVRMPTIPLGGSIMYMYYGNSSAKAGSNMHNAFEFFDDFSDDSGLWNLTKGGDGGTTLTEGNAMVYAGSSSGNYGKFVTKQSYPVVNTSIMTSYRLFVRAVFIRFPKCAYALSSAYISPVSNTWSIRSYGYTPMPNHTQETCFSIGTYKDGVRRPCGSWGPYINAKINTTESSFYAYKNNVHVYTGNLSSKTPSPYSLLSVGEDYSFLDVLHMQVDYFIMRKYVNPEPFVVFGDAQNITSSNSGPWEWYCLSGDFSTKCSSQAAGIDGKCGPAAKSYASEETVFVQPFCNVGNNSPTTIKFPEPGQSVSWTCQGSNGGKSETCNARRDMLEFDSKMISHTIPASMLPEEVFKNVTVTMQNTGSVTWNRSSGIKLGASGDATLFGPMRIELPAGTSVATGGQYVFKFDIKAPKNPKNYSIQYKMVKE